MATIKKSPVPQRVKPTKPVKQAAPQYAGQPDAEDEAAAFAAAAEDAEQEDTDADTSDMQDADDTDSEAVAEDDEQAPPTDDDLEADTASAAQPAASTAEPAPAAPQQPAKAKTPASGPQKGAGQLGFAKRTGHTSTKPVKPATMARPYLDSPRDFGIHIEGHLVRFKKGRTPIREDNPAFAQHALTVAQVLTALKTDSYVADNGAEVVE